MKIIDVMWFCAGHGNCGIVKIEDPYEGNKYYIGSFPGEEGNHNEQEDIQWIAEWGSSFPREAGNVLFGVEE
jgi:hypothetical protein